MEVLVLLLIALIGWRVWKKRPKRVTKQSIRASVRQADAMSALQKKYQPVLRKHEQLLEKIRTGYSVAKESKRFDGPAMNRVIALCKEDIKLAKDVIEFYKKSDKIYGFNDNCYPFDTFKRLAIIYEKQGKYDEAIAVCQQAIKHGIKEDGTEGGMVGRIAKLKRRKRETNGLKTLV